MSQRPRAGGAGDDQPGAVLSPAAASRYLGADRKTVYAAIARGELPALHLGRRLFIAKATLDRMLAGERP
jgi:excisionase family DNA binding protein